MPSIKTRLTHFLNDFPHQILPYKSIIILSSFIVVSILLFSIIAGKHTKPLFSARDDDTREIALKLSSDDLVALSNKINRKWTKVQMIETNGRKYKINIRALPQTELDFQLEIDDIIYNMFKLTDNRKKLYQFFLTAENWNLERSYPWQVKLKINAVPIGDYLMEPDVYPQLRDDNGNYLIRLNTDTHLMRKIHYIGRTGNHEYLKKYFNLNHLAAYMIFFTIMSDDAPPGFDHMVFRYEAKNKTLTPYLTIESMITHLSHWEKKFKPPQAKGRNFFSEMTPENSKYTLSRSKFSSYHSFVSTVLNAINQ